MKLEQLAEELKRMPMTAGFVQQIEILQSRYGDEYVQVAEDILYLLEVMGLDVVKISRKYIYDYLKQLEYFISHKSYGHTDFEKIKNEIYNNERIMLETYLPGLLMSYAYTTILGTKNHIFLTEFLPRLKDNMRGVEIGFGEGFYLWEIFRHYPQAEITGYDISGYSIQFATNLLQAANVSAERYHLKYGNIFDGIQHADESADFGVLTELIEHIPNPQVGIHEIVRMIKSGGLLYLTTVINSNHMDHISNFESPDIVRRMLEQEGVNIVFENIYYMTDDFPESQDVSIGLAFVAQKK